MTDETLTIRTRKQRLIKQLDLIIDALEGDGDTDIVDGLRDIREAISEL